MDHSQEHSEKAPRENDANSRPITDPKQVDQALQQREAELAVLFDNVPAAVVIVDKGRRVCKTNRMAERMAGRTSDEMRGLPSGEAWRCLHALDNPAGCGFGPACHTCSLRTLVLDTLEHGNAHFSVETLMDFGQDAPRERRHVLVSSVPLTTAQGDMALVMFEDITEQKRVEEALQQSDLFQRSVLDGLSAHIAVIDENGTILATNKAWRDFAVENSVVLENALEGANYLAICDSATGPHSAEAAPFAQAIRSILAGELDHYELEYPCHSPDVKRWFCGRVTPFPGSGHRRAVVAHENITERKLAEEALRESEMRLRQAAQAGNVGLWDWDLRTDRVYYSPEWKRQIGYKDHEICNDFSEWQSRVHPDDLDRCTQAVQAFIKKPWPDYHLEFRLRHKDGSYRWLLAQAALICDEHGTPVRMLGSHMDITERKEMEQALLRSQEQLSLAIEGSGVGLWNWMVQTGEASFNERWASMAGYALSELAPTSIETWKRLAHPDDLKKSDALLQEHFAGQSPYYECEARIRHKDGHWVWVLDRGKVTHRDSENRPTRMAGTHLDITERKQAEEALRASNRFNDQIISGAAEGIVVYDRDMRYILWNRFMEEMTGVPAEQAIGRCAFDLFPHLRDQDVQMRLRRVMAGETVAPVDTPFHIPSTGRTGWVAATYSPHRGPDGNVVGVVAMIRDVTERKNAEKALEASAAKYRQLYESMMDAYASTDMEGHLREFNRVFTNMLGYSEEELRALTYQDITPENLHASEAKIVEEQIIARGYSDAYEKEYRRKDGTLVPVELRTSLMRDEAARPSGMWAIIRDISERKRAEKEKARFEDQLRQIQKLDALGQLAAGVAHDFNNLLTAIRGNTQEAMRILAGDDEAREPLEAIEQAVGQAAEITQSLLTFSRELPAEERLIDLREVVENARALIRHSLPRAITLEVVSKIEAPLWVRADETQLHQVLLNLALNARDAMSAGGMLRISVLPVTGSVAGALSQARSAEPEFVRISVTDTGIGMPPEIMARVFEPFFTTKPHGQGTGLGLSIVHGIVREHEGQITVESDVGKGTTFTITLPCTQLPIESPETMPSPRRSGHGELILLAVRDAYLRGTLAGVIESFGYTVIPADDSSVVRRMLGHENQEVRLVVLQEGAPGESLLAEIDHIRAAHPTLPVILLSANPDAATGLSSGRIVALGDPLTMSRLLETIADLLLPT